MAKEVSAEQLFENIALDNQLITKFQLEKAKKALEDQDNGDAANVEDVLVEMGFITEKQLDSIKSAQNYRTVRNTDKRFGRQIVRMKLATNGHSRASQKTKRGLRENWEDHHPPSTPPERG